MKAPTLSDGTGVNLRSVVEFARSAAEALRDSEEEDAAHYFEMLETFLIEDVSKGRPFKFSYKVLGL